MNKRRKTASLLLSILLLMLTVGTSYAAEGAQNIKVDIHHILLEADDPDLLKVKEVLKFNNTGNNVFAGEKTTEGTQKVLDISLPAGYLSLQVDGLGPNTFIVRPDRIETTAPLNPGLTQISLTYELSLAAGSLDFSKTLDYPTDMFYVLSPKGLLKIKSKGQIEDLGIQSLNGENYHVLAIPKAEPSQNFTLTVSPDRLKQGYREPKSGFHSISHLERWANSPLRDTNPHIWVGAIMLFFLAAATGGGYYINKKQQRRQYEEQEEKMAHMLDNLYIRQRRLLDKIVALDQKKEQEQEQDQVETEEYDILRKQYIGDLTKVKIKIREHELLEE